MKKRKGLEIIELFMFRAGTDWKRTFTGQIIRDKTDDGKDIVYGRVDVGGCRVIGCAENQDQLGLNLDSACTLILDFGIDKMTGQTTTIFKSQFNLS
jgi:hypothetical protein